MKPRRRVKKREGFRLLVPIEESEAHFSFGVQWMREAREPWSEYISIEFQGSVEKPDPLPRVLRPRLRLNVSLSRDLTVERRDRLPVIGFYEANREELAASIFLPSDLFRTLLAMRPFAVVSLELTYPEHRRGEIESVSFDQSRFESDWPSLPLNPG